MHVFQFTTKRKHASLYNEEGGENIMSCPYYIYTRDMNMAFDFAPKVSINGDYREFCIHIMTTSIGWKPAFEAHRPHIESFRNLRELLLSGKYSFQIRDIYNNVYTPIEFIQYCIDRNNEGGKSNLSGEGQGRFYDDSDGYEFSDRAFE